MNSRPPDHISPALSPLFISILCHSEMCKRAVVGQAHTEEVLADQPDPGSLPVQNLRRSFPKPSLSAYHQSPAGLHSSHTQQIPLCDVYIGRAGADLVSASRASNYFPDSGSHSPIPFTEENLRQQIAELGEQLKDLDEQIASIKGTIYSFSAIYGTDLVKPELLETVRPARRTRRRGLTEACRAVLGSSIQPRSVREVCDLVRTVDPSLLSDHRNAMASVMSVLRNLESQGEVVRGTESGRSVWQMARPCSGPEHEGRRSKVPECFQ